MDVDNILSQFGEKSKSKANAAFDVDSILSEFGGKEPTTTEKSQAITIRTPKPPISGISKEASDELNQTRLEKQGGENPRDGIVSVPVKAGKAIYDTAASSAEEARQGLGDALSGKPASGLGKVGMGLLGVVGSPFEGVGSIAGDLTGNKDFADKAGLLASTAVPVVPSANFISNRLPKNKALSELIDKITSGGRDQQALVDTVKAMKADSRIGPADTSPAVLNMTQKLFTTEGDVAKNYLHATSSNRMYKLPEDVTKAFDTAGGAPVNVIQKLNDLTTASKKVGNDIINPALAGAKPVELKSTLTAIDDVLKPGVLKIGDSVPLTEVKKELESIRKSLRTSKEYDAKDLHAFQSGLRRTAESLLKSPDGGSKQVGEALMKVRNNLVNDINAVSPKIKIIEDGVEKEVGQYKHGLSQYREEMHVADSFRWGYEGLGAKAGLDKNPEITKKKFDALTDAEKEAAREGRRLAIAHKIESNNNPSLTGTNLGKSDFNKKELEIFFGKEGTEKLLRDLENTRAIKNTHNKIIEGSQTQMRAAGDEAIALPTKPDTNPLNKYITPAVATAAEMTLGQGTGLGALSTLALAGAAKVGSSQAFKIKTAIAKERNVQLAKLALPTEGPSRDALIQSLEAAIPGPKQSIVRRGANTLSRLVAP